MIRSSVKSAHSDAVLQIDIAHFSESQVKKGSEPRFQAVGSGVVLCGETKNCCESACDCGKAGKQHLFTSGKT